MPVCVANSLLKIRIPRYFSFLLLPDYPGSIDFYFCFIIFFISTLKGEDYTWTGDIPLKTVLPLCPYGLCQPWDADVLYYYRYIL